MHSLVLPRRALATAAVLAALVASLLLGSAGTARADVETSCAHRNENSLKPVRSESGRGERVKTVCEPEAATVAAPPVPTVIPAGDGGLTATGGSAAAAALGALGAAAAVARRRAGAGAH